MGLLHFTCLGHLGRCDTDRIWISVTPPKVAKASTSVSPLCHCLQRCRVTFASVNMTFKIVVDVSMTVYEASSGLYYKDITIVTIQIDAQNCGITFIKL